MDVLKSLQTTHAASSITTIDMHTTGEPTRIVISGFPKLSGSLLSQRRQLQEHHDHLRRRIILEPRGHWDMYGALLIQETELTASGDADIGVLFMTNDGYSTMCGHATIALGRFLVDTHDLSLFSNRGRLRYDATSQSIEIRLHAPCGVVCVTCPTLNEGSTSDPSRPVSYLSVPSFATAIDVTVTIPPELQWPTLKECERDTIMVDFAYGGAFYALVHCDILGWDGCHRLGNEDFVDVEALRVVANTITKLVNENPDLKKQAIHSVGEDDLRFLYSVIIVDDTNNDVEKSENGICFFADSQIDRSPTGSGVQARVALAHAAVRGKVGDLWTYNSLISTYFDHDGAFVGEVAEEVQNEFAEHDIAKKAVRVRVEGFAKYTGTNVFVVESDDRISQNGFSLKEVAAAQ